MAKTRREDRFNPERAARRGSRPKSLSRDEVESQLAAAREAGTVPTLSGRFMAGGDYSGIDFTSDFESKAGPFTSELLGADFRNAKLAGCNLSRADLASANLRGTDLRGANLEGANLYTALLEDSNLGGANLSGANLISAEMQGVRLSDADLEGARFGQTSIGGVDLSGTLHSGLATHLRPFV